MVFFGENVNEIMFEGKPLTTALVEINTELFMALRSPMALIFKRKWFEWGLQKQHRECYKVIQKFRKEIAEIIQKKRESGKKTNDLISKMQETQSLPNPEDRLSDFDIINEFLTFFLAGMDTTGHLVAIGLYLAK